MKKLIISTLAIVLLQVSVLHASSVSFLNPSIDIVVNNTISSTNNNGIISFNKLYSPNYNLLISLEKKRVFVRVKDNNENTSATATINLISNSGEVVQGPIDLIEGEVIEIEVEEPDLGIQIIQLSKDAIVEFWYSESH